MHMMLDTDFLCRHGCFAVAFARALTRRDLSAARCRRCDVYSLHVMLCHVLGLSVCPEVSAERIKLHSHGERRRRCHNSKKPAGGSRTFDRAGRSSEGQFRTLDNCQECVVSGQLPGHQR